MERTFHMLLYRAFHAQRNILRPYMRALGLGAGQPKLIAYLAEHGPCRQSELHRADRAGGGAAKDINLPCEEWTLPAKAAGGLF